jgi:hypothetical protein
MEATPEQAALAESYTGWCFTELKAEEQATVRTLMDLGLLKTVWEPLSGGRRIIIAIWSKIDQILVQSSR